MCVMVYNRVCLWRPKIDAGHLPLPLDTVFFLRQGLLLNLELTILVGWQVIKLLEPFCLHAIPPSSVRVTDSCHHVLILGECWGLNFRSHVCIHRAIFPDHWWYFNIIKTLRVETTGQSPNDIQFIPGDESAISKRKHWNRIYMERNRKCKK